MALSRIVSSGDQIVLRRSKGLSRPCYIRPPPKFFPPSFFLVSSFCFQPFFFFFHVFHFNRKGWASLHIVTEPHLISIRVSAPPNQLVQFNGRSIGDEGDYCALIFYLDWFFFSPTFFVPQFFLYSLCSSRLGPSLNHFTACKSIGGISNSEPVIQRCVVRALVDGGKKEDYRFS